MSFVIIHAERIKDGNVETGILLYPSCVGHFRTEDKQTEFNALFEGDAPKVPFAGVGKKFGREIFTDDEKKAYILEYLKKKYSMPKDLDTYWLKDELMHNDLVFPLICPFSKLRDEDPQNAAIRGLWECTGLKIRNLNHVGEYNDKHVYSTKIYVDRAKWEWMNHQAEKMTLTDWGVCPHFDLLEELGVPSVVLDAYCKTHGGPRFVTNINDHLLDETTKEVFLHFYTPNCVLRETTSPDE